MTFLLNPRFIAALMVAFFLAGTHWKVYRMGEKAVQTKWNEERAEIAKQSLKLSEQAARTAADLQDKSDKLREAKNAQISRLNTQLADALDRVRNRPERPSEGGLPNDASTGTTTGCTGAQLYRADAAAFVREADRAQRVLADLAQCQAAYNNARAALNQGN